MRSSVYLARVRKGALTLIMLALSVVAVLPFLWMLSASFTPTAAVFDFPISWIPKHPTLANYVTVWRPHAETTIPIPSFATFFLNSVVVSLFSVAGQVTTGAIAGYAFAKIRFKGRNVAFLLYIATLMFPDQMLMVPRFVLYRLWGLYNKLLALILPGMFTAFGTFLFRQFFTSVPEELIDSSKIDGANHWRTFSRIVLPLSGPIISTMVIISFVWSWNQYENPLVFISNSKLFTIPLGVLLFQLNEATDYGAVIAGTVCSLAPIFLVFLSLQKYFIEGVVMTGIKG